MNDTIAETIATTTHGRYLIARPAASRGAPMLLGFHGYGEGAETEMERLRAIPSAGGWLVVSVQGLHRFYQRRTNDVIASWMTRQDRELAIADNLAYVAAIVEKLRQEWSFTHVVFAGFSQGVAMAFRAAAASTVRVAGVIAAGGDVPPEIGPAGLAHVGSALLCRGVRDEWYTSAKFADDQRRLRDANVPVRPVEFDGGHEWTTDVIAASDDFLRGVRA